MARSPEKSQAAFRTIREVADWLGVPTHVLRFWESKFDQIAPVKGAGGRRYYRPEDMRLLGGIKVLLHDEGMTIRAVAQRIEEGGVAPIMALSPELAVEEPTPAPRTRRVIRKGDGAKDGAAKPAPDAPPPDAETSDPASPEPEMPASDAPVSIPDPVPIAKDPASPLSETLPEQPDAPVPSRAAPEPSEPLPEAPAPEPEPMDTALDRATPIRPPEIDDAAPSDPPHQVRHAPEPDPLPEPVAPADPPAQAPVAPRDPLARARALAQGAAPLAPLDRKRLRRLVRRYRALAEEIADDLSEGSPN